MTADDRTPAPAPDRDVQRQPPDRRLSPADPWPVLEAAEWRIAVTMPSSTVVIFDVDSEAAAFDKAQKFERSIAYRIERRFVTPWQAVTPHMKTTAETVEQHTIVDPGYPAVTTPPGTERQTGQ